MIPNATPNEDSGVQSGTVPEHLLGDVEVPR